MFSRFVMKALYRRCEFGMLTRGDRPNSDGACSASDSLARTVSTLLRAPCAATRAADIRARAVRQRSEVDAGHAGPRHAAGHLSSLSAFHHPHRLLVRHFALLDRQRDLARHLAFVEAGCSE